MYYQGALQDRVSRSRVSGNPWMMNSLADPYLNDNNLLKISGACAACLAGAGAGGGCGGVCRGAAAGAAGATLARTGSSVAAPTTLERNIDIRDTMWRTRLGGPSPTPSVFARASATWKALTQKNDVMLRSNG